MAEQDRGIKIFIQYGLLILGLGGFNFYWYLKKSGGKASLAMAIVCAVAFAGWVVFYFAYVRKKAQ